VLHCTADGREGSIWTGTRPAVCSTMSAALPTASVKSE